MLKQRVLSAIVMVLLLLVILFAMPLWATRLLIAVIVCLASWEWSALIPLRNPKGRAAAVLLVAAVFGFCWQLTQTQAVLISLLWAAALWWTAALLWILWDARRVSSPAAALAGLLAIVPAGTALMRLRLDYVHGAAWLLLAVAVVAAADTGAYFAGRAFGRIKLAPNISPGKSWEGVVGGCLLAMLVGAVGATWLGSSGSSAWFAASLAALIGAAYSVVGDLTESMLKRHAGVKDSGALLPGHGGLLDRFDSICAGVPVLMLCWIQFGVLR